MDGLCAKLNVTLLSNVTPLYCSWEVIMTLKHFTYCVEWLSKVFFPTFCFFTLKSHNLKEYALRVVFKIFGIWTALLQTLIWGQKLDRCEVSLK